MKRYGILLVAAVTAAALFLIGRTPSAKASLITVQPQTAVKTVLCPGTVTDEAHVRLFVRESLASVVSIEQAVTVSGAGFREESYTGTVTAVSNEATTIAGKTGLSAVVTLSKTDDSVKKGLTAAARIATETLQDVAVIPRKAVVADERGSFVWVVKNGRADRRAVTVETATEAGFAVSGLTSGERVVADPTAVDRSGQKITEAVS